MRKLIALILAAVMVLSVPLAAYATSPHGPVMTAYWYTMASLFPNFYTQETANFGGGSSRGGGVGRYPPSGNHTITHYNSGATSNTPIYNQDSSSIYIPGTVKAPSSGGSSVGGTTGAILNYTSSNMTTYNNTVTNTVYNNITNNTYNTTYQTTNYRYDVNIENNYYDIYNIEITYAPTYINIYYMDAGGHTYEDFYYIALPDGRSSADMYAFEMHGLVVDYEVVNYDVHPDSLRTLHLSHFDGDLKDSSYYDVPLHFTSGASYTYVDAGAFGSALYLPPGYRYMQQLGYADTDGTWVPQYKYDYDQLTYEARVYVTAGNNISGYSGILREFIFGTANLNICYNTANPSEVYLTYFEPQFEPEKLSSGARMVIGAWNHIAFTRNGNVCEYFLNGISLGNFTPSSNKYLAFFRNGWFDSMIYLDEVRVSQGILYTGNFVPASRPYDTNRVLVLPDGDQADYTLAVKSEIPINGYRVGGVRTSEPQKGNVYLPLDAARRVVDCQIYDGSDWLSVDGRIYVNGSWQQLAAYEVIVGDAPEPDPDDPGGTDPDNPGGGDSGGGFDWGSIGDIIGSIASGLGGIIGGILSGVLSLIGVFTDILGVFANFGSGFIGFLSSVMPFIPSEIISVISLGFTLVITLSVIRLIRG